MKRFNFYASSDYYRYNERSCETCVNASRCVAIVNKDWSNRWLDLAKCGCKLFCGLCQTQKKISKEVMKKPRRGYKRKGFYQAFSVGTNSELRLLEEFIYAKTAYTYKRRIEDKNTQIIIKHIDNGEK
ncbi:MAG: hypothetical protein WCS17_01815 [Prevotella sp.]